MVKKDITIKNKTGLHARPASIFVENAGKFESDIKIEFNDEEINGKSIMALMSLGIEAGKQITLKISGEDESEAMEELTYLVNEKLPEGDSD